MTKEKLEEEIIIYLKEQRIIITDKDDTKSLVIKAMKEGYSPSDEMRESPTAEFIPTDDEVEKAPKNVYEPQSTGGCMISIINVLILMRFLPL